MKYNVEPCHETKLKIEKLNQALSRSLKTLEYIYMIETDYEKKHQIKGFEELLNFKVDIQEHIIRTTEKINSYKISQDKLES